MMSKLSASLILVAALSAALAHGSAVKGHLPAQPVQRAEVKSPVLQQQQQERSPKSAPAPGQSAAPILESSKKVYNDISYRRSPSQQAAAEPVQQVAAAAKAEQPAKEAPANVQEAPKAAAPAEPLAKATEPAKPSEELPPHSARSAPVQEEAKQAAPVVVVEQVVPAKVPAEAVVPQQQQQAPAAGPEPKPEPQLQPAPVVPAAVQAQPEPAVEPPKASAQESSLMAKKDEPVAPKESSENIEVPAPDPALVLSEPIDSTTKLLIDLDEHVQKFLPAEDKQDPAQAAKEAVLIHGVDYSPAGAAHAAGEAQPSGKSSAPLMPYSSNVENEPIVPPLPSSLDKVEKATGAQSPPSPSSSAAAAGPAPGQQSATRQANHQHQNQQQVITQLLDQLDSLQNRIQDTINQLVARRRYVMSALLRPMGTYVRRVRTNLERLQNRVSQLQAAATSVGGNTNPNQRPGSLVDTAAIETIQKRINDISKRISEIVNRIRFSLTPTSAPLNNNGRK